MSQWGKICYDEAEKQLNFLITSMFGEGGEGGGEGRLMIFKAINGRCVVKCIQNNTVKHISLHYYHYFLLGVVKLKIMSFISILKNVCTQIVIPFLSDYIRCFDWHIGEPSCTLKVGKAWFKVTYKRYQWCQQWGGIWWEGEEGGVEGEWVEGGKQSERWYRDKGLF